MCAQWKHVFLENCIPIKRLLCDFSFLKCLLILYKRMTVSSSFFMPETWIVSENSRFVLLLEFAFYFWITPLILPSKHLNIFHIYPPPHFPHPSSKLHHSLARILKEPPHCSPFLQPYHFPIHLNGVTFLDKLFFCSKFFIQILIPPKWYFASLTW